MPNNKKAILRYQVLDSCFRDTKKKYEIDELLKIVNKKLFYMYNTEISLRQLRTDISFMRDSAGYNAPIETYLIEGKRCYYRYSDENFSIFKNELSVEETEKLRAIIEMLAPYRGIASNAWLEEVISNLEYRFGIKSNPENLISFEQNEELFGLEYLSDMIDYTINHQPLEINYRTYKGAEKTYTFHPYFMKQYNGRWFIFGVNEGFDNVTNLALDRIHSYKPTNVPFRKNEKIDFNSYFKNIIGVTVPDDDVKVETIVLRFSPNRYPYVVSKPLHPSQEVVADSENTIAIHVKPTRELNQEIFSFIPDIEVLSPEWYREEIKEKMEENLNKYLSVK